VKKLQRLVKQANSSKLNLFVSIAIALAVGFIGYRLIVTLAAGPVVSVEPGGSVVAPAAVINDATASDGKAIQFGAVSAPPANISAPTELRAVTGGNNIALDWKTAASDVDVIRYNVIRDGRQIATVEPSPTSYISPAGTRYYDSDVTAGQDYDYQVSAVNARNETSSLSSVVNATQPTSTTAQPNVTYDTSEATDLAQYVEDFVKPTIDTWYSKVADAITRQEYDPIVNFSVTFDKDYTGLAEVRSCNQMVVNPEWPRNNPGDMGVYVHELTHVIQCYGGAPTVITEGIADWTREYIMNDRAPRFPSENETYASGYAPSSYFLNWILETYNRPTLISDFNIAANAKTFTYDNFVDETGKPVQRLWYEMTNRKVSAPGSLKTEQNKCADVLNYSTTNGNTIQVVGCAGNTAQEWMHIYRDSQDENGAGELRALNKCMDVAGSGTADGTRVQIYDCNKSVAQDWIVGSNGSLVNPNSNKCLQPSGGIFADGTPLEISTCNGSAAQRWTVPMF